MVVQNVFKEETRRQENGVWRKNGQGFWVWLSIWEEMQDRSGFLQHLWILSSILESRNTGGQAGEMASGPDLSMSRSETDWLQPPGGEYPCEVNTTGISTTAARDSTKEAVVLKPPRLSPEMVKLTFNNVSISLNPNQRTISLICVKHSENNLF